MLKKIKTASVIVGASAAIAGAGYVAMNAFDSKEPEKKRVSRQSYRVNSKAINKFLVRPSEE